MKLLFTRVDAIELIDPAQLIGIRISGPQGAGMVGTHPKIAYNLALAIINEIMTSPIAQKAALPDEATPPVFRVEALPNGVRLEVSSAGESLLVDSTMSWDAATKLRDQLTGLLTQRSAPPSLN